MEASDMDDSELDVELRKAANNLDQWRERGLPKTKEELDEHFVHFMAYHKLAAEALRRTTEREAGRKAPWN